MTLGDTAQHPLEDTGIDIFSPDPDSDPDPAVQPAYVRPHIVKRRSTAEKFSCWFFTATPLVVFVGIFLYVLRGMENASSKLWSTIGLLVVMAGCAAASSAVPAFVRWLHGRRASRWLIAGWFIGMALMYVGTAIVMLNDGPKPPTPIASFNGPKATPVPAQPAQLPTTVETATSSAPRPRPTATRSVASPPVVSTTTEATTSETSASDTSSTTRPATTSATTKPAPSTDPDQPVNTDPPAEDPEPIGAPDPDPPADEPQPEPGQVVVPVDPNVNQEPTVPPADGIAVAPPQ